STAQVVPIFDIPPTQSNPCHASTAQPSSTAVKPRSWVSPRSTCSKWNSNWTPWARKLPNATCTTTTSRHTRWGRPVVYVHQNVAKLHTAHWPTVPVHQYYRIATNAHTPFARYPKPWAPTVPPRWAPSVPQPCPCTTPVCHCAHPLQALPWAWSPTPSITKPVTPP